jgi:hypothetical protein
MEHSSSKTALEAPGAGHDPHLGHGPASRREFEHKGHLVVIEAKYQITVDGIERPLMISIGEDGRATTHAIPYKVYSSLVDLMKDLIDLYPGDYSAEAPNGGTTPGETSGGTD